jgi:alkylation response protein AidB-like acyl-CoA dehydrogenase
MTTYHAPTEDLGFLLREVLDVPALLTLPAFAHADWDVVTGVLEEGARFATEVLSPVNAAGDRDGTRLANGTVEYPPGFAAAFARYAEDGWLGLDMPLELGGQGLPRVVQAAFAEMTNGANLAFSMLPVTLRAACRLLLQHGGPELLGRYGPGLVDGRCAATIAITEAQAGSDVGRLATLATPAPDGSYALTGQKIFISNGDHELSEQVVHMVLARTPGAAAGTRGVSLFVVPKWRGDVAARARNGVRVERLEHKMGLNGSPTCVVAFEGATGYRIGPEGRGLQQMFAMVNTMRLEVAVQGVGVAGAATARAVRYALERRQGGHPGAPPVPIAEHADVRRMLMTMRARTESIRALTLEAALQLDLADHAPDEPARARALGLAQWLLPICKAWGSDTGFEVANLAVQVFGGHGYVRDSGVEQYVRDVRIAGIYEGTNGIQAIDLVLRKLVADQGLRAREWLARMRADLDAATGPALAPLAARLAPAVDALAEVSESLLARAAEPAALEGSAVAYLRLAGLVGGGWMWLRMAAAARTDRPLHRMKHRLAAFYLECLLPEHAALARTAREGTAAGGTPDTQEWSAGV